MELRNLFHRLTTGKCTEYDRGIVDDDGLLALPVVSLRGGGRVGVDRYQWLTCDMAGRDCTLPDKRVRKSVCVVFLLVVVCTVSLNCTLYFVLRKVCTLHCTVQHLCTDSCDGLG
ncbi:hypothetical protein BO99DRAFT_97289 [Aspergillus violaceofuscus CBS 115571]|uniref:Uncharacterized protein n=1 Tax=Aspergillus violaceofuscus (strain CBS 115571) TaxID=1450538 RepID=A0A2V5IAN1_ASPV1|nr:hypothetical protein BO99DRAFT_97289 [Aspergillus violaceofuscus CBS 115571]